LSSSRHEITDPVVLRIAIDKEAAMTWGIPTALFVQIHVSISLIGIASGLVVVHGLLTGKPMGGWAVLFLGATILTSVTGFPLPPFGFDPPRTVGVLSLVLLAMAVVALYAFHLAGAWRWLYIVSALAALYLNVFVGVIQAFMKLPFLQSLAPTQSEPPFLVAQLAVLTAFVVIGVLAVLRYRPAIKPIT
jgi:hypothetical protein